MPYFEEINNYPNSNTVWNLYNLLPKDTYFYFEIINANDSRVLDSVSFQKSDETERKKGEDDLRFILFNFDEDYYLAIKFQWNYNRGSNALIQAILDEDEVC